VDQADKLIMERLNMYPFKKVRLRPGQSGFTLIELMIVVAIITILAAVGYPSYTDYVMRSHRQAAKNAIFQIADRQEQFFLDNRSYAATLMALGYPANVIGLKRDGQLTTSADPDRTYILAMGAPTATTYTLAAVPQLVQAGRDTDCAILFMTQSGDRDATGPSEECW
jgi:type IV pilus assembly protein PilE